MSESSAWKRMAIPVFVRDTERNVKLESLLGTFLAVAALLVACSASLADRERDARAALDGRDWVRARSLAEEALRSSDTGSDLAIEWRLEQIRLEALASDKQGANVVSSLTRLAASHPQQVTAALYLSCARCSAPA